MTSESSLQIRKTATRVVREQMGVHRWNWTSAGACCGLFFGILCPFLGSILTALTWITGPQWHGFSVQRYGTVLFFLTIPLLIFGGHCLDLSDSQDEEARKRDSTGLLGQVSSD